MQVLAAHRTNRGSTTTKALTSTPSIPTYGNILCVHPCSHIILSSAPYMAATRALAIERPIMVSNILLLLASSLSTAYSHNCILHGPCAHTALPTESPPLVPSALNT